MADAVGGANSGQAAIAGVEAAAVAVRTAGYCVLCDRIVELTPDGACGVSEQHSRAAVSGRLVLVADEPLPVLPRFNVAAFLIPPIWGPAHAQWAGAIFLPLWLFADNVVSSVAGRGAFMAAGAFAVVLATLGAQLWFGKRANGLAWRRESDRTSVERFSQRQRAWAVVAVPVWLLAVAWAVYYRLGHPF